MEHDFWHDRWRTRQIGFHQSGPHPFLERWWPSLGVPARARVYVPLCGKSLDMVWLAVRGHAVVGSELSAIAVEDFFGEQRAPVDVRPHGPFQRHAAGAVELLQGDAFDLTAELLGPVQAAYDRAALVALPPDLRVAYALQFAELMPPGSRTLLIGFEYAQHRKPGPPFSVEADEIERLYRDAFDVRELERVDIIGSSPKFAAAGVESLYEVAYALTRR
ncbi:MAG TPA: thiopurine S-methyltransferase [Steroidobacteraceae bacterium]|nr:thiopurine S-methyltransferase [Steroidobacteraceae bacterium]